MLTEAQRAEFFRKGFTLLPGALPAEQADRMVDEIWRTLEEEQGMLRQDRSTWIAGGVRGIGHLNQKFRPFGSSALNPAIDDLLGQDAWKMPPGWGQVLVTFPAEEWEWNSLFQGLVDVTKINWHTDYPYDTPPEELSGVQVFCLLADLETGGGGTLVVEGSHRVIQNFVRSQPSETLQKMKRARQALLNSHPWFRQVSEAISLPRPESWYEEQRSEIDGQPVAVAELTGQKGDIYLSHPWLLHAPSPNCNAAPRLMCTQRIR